MKRHIQRLIPVLLLLFVGVFLQTAEAEETAQPPAPPAYTNEELLTQMLVVDVSERTLDNLPAIAVTFSQDLDPTADYNSFVTLTDAGKAVDGSWVLTSDTRRLYFTNIKPQTEYRVQIRPGVSARNGLKLMKPGDFTLKTRDVRPAFDFTTTGSVLPAKLTNGLPVRVVNVPELDIEFLRVQPTKLPEMLKNFSVGGRLSQWQLDDINAVTESVYASRYVTDAKPNARTSLVIPVESIKELQEPGLYFAIMRQPGRFGDSAYRITQFVVTNIGLHVRLYPRGLEVFANALDTGRPIEGVQLRLQGEKETLELTTDAQGHAGFAHRPQGNLLLVANKDGQFAFLDMREPALDLSEYDVAGLPDQPIAPFIYGARDLFRPGEAVDLSILARNRDGEAVSLKNLDLRIVRPDSKIMLKENLPVANADLGYFSYHLAIPGDAPTGRWKAEVRINAKDESPVSTFNFNVEEFMPERMKLSLSSEEKLLTSGEKLIVAVQGDYLYGAPASGNKFTAVRSVNVNRNPFAKQMPDFYFGDPADEKLVSREDLPTQTLNEQGSVFLEVPPLEGKINSPLTVRITGSLYETGGRAVTRTLDEAFWPTQHLVGIHPLFADDTVEANGQADFELARVNPDGQPAPLDKELAVTLVREEKDYFWEYNDSEGWQRKELSSEYPLLQQRIKLDAQARGKASFSVQYGYYRVEVEDPETGLKAVYPFHAGWDWERDSRTAARPDQIQLALDKPAYQLGDTVHVKMTPPSAGEAIVAVEGESMLWSTHVSLPETGASVDIPLDQAWNRHDLYITVTSFRPASAQQKIAPNRALGIAYLPLERASRKLNLSIEAPDEVLPEQTTQITVKADNLAGENAMVTLSAVDVGVLNITSFKTPDPFAYYFGQHRYGVDLYDDYGKIIEFADGSAMRQRFGGDAGGGRGGPRGRATPQIVSLFSGAVSFDAEGKAQINLPLPGFDGTLRLMAVAASADRFGSAEREMKVASPVVATLAGPRFLAAGDNSFLSIDLGNTTASNQAVNLKVDADPMLDFVPVERAFNLLAGKRETLRLPLAARQLFGVGKVNLTLEGKNFTAHRQLQLNIRPAYPAKHLAQSRELAKGESMRLDASIMQGFVPSSLNANLSIATTPPLYLHSALNGLLQYPYGCLEQTISAAWPYLFLEADTSEKLGLEPIDMQERNARVQAAILRLAGMQLANGSFTLWGNYGAEEFWLTPYAADFLLDAKDQGFAVPDWLLERVLNNLKERLQEGYRYVDSRYEFSDTPEHLDLAARAYAAYVLSRLKQAPLGTLRAMYDQDAGKAASGLPLVHLGLALTAQGDKRRGDEAIKKGLVLVRDDAKYLGDYGSRLRDQAAMLYLLLKNKTTIPDQSAQINKLTDELHDRAYLSTQEQLFTFLAGLQIQEKAGQSWKARLKLGESQVSLAQKSSFTKALSVEEMAHGVDVTAAGDTPLYVGLTLDGYPDAAPATRTDPVEIQRDWFSMKGKKLQAGEIKVGDLVLVHLQITSQNDIKDALVVDLTPAGLEVENTNLADAESLDEIRLDGFDKPLPELLGSSDIRYQEFRDDRYVAALSLNAKTRHHLFYMARVVSSGDFVVPPPYVEDMYRPEINGVGTTPGKLLIE